jgi:sulfide:quinone oxidoreductase
LQVVGPRHLILQPSGTELHPDRTVTLPTITGPNIRGIPGDAIDRFLAIDQYCRVRDTDGRIFAAGDATDLPVKHGGLGAQQADTAAAAIAHLAGVAEAPDPLRPMIRGTLLTGGKPLYMAAHLIAGHGWRTEIYEQPPWPMDDKVVAVELGPYLSRIKPAAPDR